MLGLPPNPQPLPPPSRRHPGGSIWAVCHIRPNYYHAVMGIRPTGSLGSTPFDINKDGQTFVSAISGYLWMSEEELGFDLTILNDGGRYIQITDSARWPDGALWLGRAHKATALRLWSGNHLLERFPGRRIRRRSCDQGFVRIEARPVENLVLKEATEAGVNNVAR